MPHTITKTAYTFDELNDRAKEYARQWWRVGAFDYDWWDAVYEDADNIAKILGIEIDRKGKHTPAIFFSGFASQGDGACFEGRYYYAKQALKRIREYAPQDTKLHNIADELQALQRKNFYALEAHVRHSGHYMHEHCTQIDVLDGRDGRHAATETADELSEILRDFMRWIYRQLEQEYQWLSADEQVDEALRVNEYDFDEHGNVT